MRRLDVGRSTLPLLAVLLLALAHLPVSTFAQGAKAASAVYVGPVPEWVERVEWAVPADSPTDAAAQILLTDQQAMLAPNGGDYYFHQVVKLLTQEAVSSFSQQTNEFSPEFGDIVWHTLIVHRDGKAEDRLPTTEFKKLQRELGLETQLLTGEITYAAVLGDIRVGDILETAYTRHYINPLLGEHSSARYYLGASHPIVRERVVVHVPHALGLATTSFELPDGTAGLPDDLYRHSRLRLAMTETSTEKEKVFSWEGRNLPAIEFDQAMPGRAYPYWPTFRVSTFMSWGNVVQWATPLFSATTLPEPVAKLVESWKKEADDQRLDKAVHWVEEDVRYFALDLGEHTLKPRPLEDVCSTRFGDCKDKAVLLVAILRALGFEAWPALTNTYWRDHLREVYPSPGAFNHAIVAYRYKGELKWIDPTMTKQRGMPAAWAVPTHRVALIVRPEEDQLTTIDNSFGKEPDTEVLDRVLVDAKTGDATLTTEVLMHGLLADHYRPTLASLNQTERSKGWFNFIALFYRRLDEIKPPVFEDDTKANTIKLRAEYRIPDFIGHDSTRTFVQVHGYLLRTLLDPNVSRRRHWPLALPNDRHLRHRIEVELPFLVETGALPEVIRTAGLEYSIERGISGHRLVVQHELRVTKDAVPADQMNQFSDNLQEILSLLSTVVFQGKETAAPKESPVPSTVNIPATPGNP